MSTEVIALLGLASISDFWLVGAIGSLLAGIVALPLGEIGASCRTPVSDWLTVDGPSYRLGAVEESLSAGGEFLVDQPAVRQAGNVEQDGIRCFRQGGLLSAFGGQTI